MSIHQNITQTRYNSYSTQLTPTSKLSSTLSISSKSNTIAPTAFSTLAHESVQQRASNTAWLPPLLGILTGLIVALIACCLYYRRCRRHNGSASLFKQDDWDYTVTQPPPAYTSLREKNPTYQREKSNLLKLQYSPQLAPSPSLIDLSALEETSSAPVRKIELYDPKINPLLREDSLSTKPLS